MFKEHNLKKSIKLNNDATLNRDRSRDLFIIGHCEAFKHEADFAIINIISILNVL
jgi:hypothetical protein